MLLEHLIRNLPSANVEGRLDRPIRGIAHDSRRVNTNDVFVALPETTEEPEARDNWIARVVDRGASAVICDRHDPIPRKATRICVPDVHEALAWAARSYYSHPSSKLQVIGICGQESATETSFYLKSLLEAADYKTGLISSIQQQIGDRIISPFGARSTSLEMHQAMAAMVREECQICVVEINEETLASKQLCGIEFDTVFQTNPWDQPCAEAHALDPLEVPQNWNPSYDEGISWKSISNHKEWDKKKAAAINIEAVSGSPSTRTWNPVVQLAHGTRMTTLLQAGQVTLDQTGSRFTVKLPERYGVCRLSSPHPHSIYNALAAAGVALRLGLPSEAIATGMKNTPTVPGLLEPIQMGQPFSVFVDKAATTSRLLDVMKALRRITTGSHEIHAVIGCAGEEGNHERLALGHVAGCIADTTIITQNNPRGESPMAIAAELAAGHFNGGTATCEIILDRAQAIERVLTIAKPGDTVLISGKGHETVQELENTVIPFDDRAEARRILESMGYCS
jgi:UDP-N-acetylmuramoyl-L-alanyl-D-glutamate--2,6-diaminopimelate ligase